MLGRRSLGNDLDEVHFFLAASDRPLPSLSARRYALIESPTPRSGRAVMLSTHSMEECEALCHRVAIMADGELKCIGSSQHLKTRFGRGFTIEARPAPGASTAPIEAFLHENLEGQVLQSEGGQLRYQFTARRAGTLSSVFALLEGARQRLSLESYSIGQTTLEQIFLHVRAEL